MKHVSWLLKQIIFSISLFAVLLKFCKIKAIKMPELTESNVDSMKCLFDIVVTSS